MTPDITQRVRSILSTAEVDGLHVRLVGQIARTDYVNTNKALEALGGKWSRRDKAHVFTADPSHALADFISGGSAPKPARTTEGYVATPDHIADMICRYPYAKLTDLPAMAVVLEPSAGDGAIVRAINRANRAIRVDAVEPNADRAALIGHGVNAAVEVATIEDYAARSRAAGARYDAVVMNPPFAMPGQPTVWIDHVRLAWDLLAPGGRLVAIVPASFADRQDKRHAEMRAFIAEHGGLAELPPNAFVASGTSVRTCVIWADR